MSYLGFNAPLTRYLRLIDHPRVLEIGVDKGQTSLPMLHNLSAEHKNFKWIGVDVRVDLGLCEQLAQMFGLKKINTYPKISLNDPDWNYCYLEINSLKILPQLATQGAKFDLIMIDGDHNYATVKEELSYINELAFDSTVVIVDDYNGRWAHRDLFYKDRNSHADISELERPDSVAGKVGVNTAVNDWLSSNKDWKLINYGHDCVLMHKEKLNIKMIGDGALSAAEVAVKTTSTSRFKAEVAQILNSGSEVFCTNK